MFFIGRRNITVVFSRYLYNKVMESNTAFINIILEDYEIEFLKKYNIFYKKNNNGTFLVDSSQIKSLFCN